MTRRVLVVDDTPATVEVVTRQLEARGETVRSAADVAEAVEILGRWSPDLVITDMRMPGPSGLELVRHLQARHPHVAVIMLTGYPSLEHAVESGRRGVHEYLAKPFTEAELEAAVERAVAAAGGATARLDDTEGLRGYIATSPAMATVVAGIRRAAATLDPAIVTGEMGAGLRRTARSIHDLSVRAVQPMLWMDCRTVATDHMEAELFGATGDAGLLERASGGSLVVEEPGLLPLAAQIRLLSFLRDRRLREPGSGRDRRLDVRVLATSTADLDGGVRAGTLRADLIQRLAGIRIPVPPLRDRPEDLPALAATFAKRWAPPEVERPAIASDVLQRFTELRWPGNVAELEAVIRCAIEASAGATIEQRHLPVELRFSAVSHPRWDRTLAEVEVDHIRQILERVGGNKSQAARILGIDRRTLRAKLPGVDDGES
jgi:DNA-binding NtrC family response regulator